MPSPGRRAPVRKQGTGRAGYEFGLIPADPQTPGDGSVRPCRVRGRARPGQDGGEGPAHAHARGPSRLWTSPGRGWAVGCASPREPPELSSSKAQVRSTPRPPPRASAAAGGASAQAPVLFPPELLLRPPAVPAPCYRNGSLTLTAPASTSGRLEDTPGEAVNPPSVCQEPPHTQSHLMRPGTGSPASGRRRGGVGRGHGRAATQGSGGRAVPQDTTRRSQRLRVRTGQTHAGKCHEMESSGGPLTFNPGPAPAHVPAALEQAGAHGHRPAWPSVSHGAAGSPKCAGGCGGPRVSSPTAPHCPPCTKWQCPPQEQERSRRNLPASPKNQKHLEPRSLGHFASRR